MVGGEKARKRIKTSNKGIGRYYSTVVDGETAIGVVEKFQIPREVFMANNKRIYKKLNFKKAFFPNTKLDVSREIRYPIIKDIQMKNDGKKGHKNKVQVEWEDPELKTSWENEESLMNSEAYK